MTTETPCIRMHTQRQGFRRPASVKAVVLVLVLQV